MMWISMAEQTFTSPEKQLLKLIEGSVPQNSVRAASIKHRSLSFFSFGAWIGRLSFLKDRLKKQFKGRGLQQLDIKLLNKILGACVFILTLYFIINIPFSIKNLKKMSGAEFNIQEGAKISKPQEASILKKALSYYLEQVRERDIFKIGKKMTSLEGVKAPSAKILEAVQDLKLVGISWSDDPDAMIEDAKAMKTFFVKRGQMIGNVKVQAIFKDRVVLGYLDEEVELK